MIAALTSVSSSDTVFVVALGLYLKLVFTRMSMTSASINSGLTVNIFSVFSFCFNKVFSELVNLLTVCEGLIAMNIFPYCGGSLSSPPQTEIESAPGYKVCNLDL